MSINYTFPADCPVAALRGVTCTGGVFARHVIDRRPVDVVAFATKVAGKQVVARIAGKPELEAAFATHNAAIALARDEKRAALESAVPGLAAYEAAMRAYTNAAAAYDMAAERGYPAREAAAASAAHTALEAVHAQYPATRLYRTIEGYRQSSNDAKGAAGDRAMTRLLAGEAIATVAADMDAEWGDAARRAVDNA
jgi:hypothetical protein